MSKTEVNSTKETEMDYDMSIHTNPDALAWAKFYTETKERVMREHPERAPFDSEENMLGWFANAMMAMHDHLTGQRVTVLDDGSAFFVASAGSPPPKAANSYNPRGRC